MAEAVTIKQAVAFRLRRHHLIDPVSADQLPAMIGDICGLQAQIPSAAEQAASVRTTNLQSGTLTKALETSRTLARTWLMRGTVHIIPSADLPLYSAAIGPAGLRELHRWLGTYGLTPDQITRASDAVCKALETGPLTRKNLADRVVALVGDHARAWIDHGWGGIVKQAALEGAICFGPTKDRDISFVRTDTWFKASPLPKRPPGPEARRCLLDRYLRAYGPATIQGFARWAGIPSGEAKQAGHDLADDLIDITVYDRPTIARREDLDDLATIAPASRVSLLPAFDPYVLGCSVKSHLADEPHQTLIYRKAGWVAATILIDGRAAGTWEAKPRGKRLNITITPFASSLAKHATDIETAAAPLGRLHGLPIAIQINAAAA